MDELTCEIRSSDSVPASSGDGDTTEVLTSLEDKDNDNVVCVLSTLNTGCFQSKQTGGVYLISFTWYYLT